MSVGWRHHRPEDLVDGARTVAVLAAVTELARTEADLAGFSRRLTGAVAKLIGARQVVLWRLDGERLLAQPCAPGRHRWAAGDMGSVPCHRDGSGTVERVVFQDVSLTGTAADTPPGSPPARDWALVAWRLGRSPLGMLAAYDSTRGGFQPDDVLTLRTAAMASALVWQHHQGPAVTVEDHRWAREAGLMPELELMRQIASQLASTRDPESALAELALAAARIAAPASSQLGQAVVLRARNDAMDVVASVGAGSGQFARALRRPTEDVLRSGLPVRFTLEEVASATEREHLVEAGIGAVALAPIPGAGERFGVLAAGFRDRRRVATDQVRRLALLADLGGLAVASATAYRREHRALETSQERLRELGLLHDATRVFSATLDVDEIEREVVRTAARLVAPDDSSRRGAAFFRIDGSTAALAHAEGYRAAAALAGDPFPVASCPELAGALANRRAMGAAHVAMAPVLVKDRPHGVVSVSRQDGRGFDLDVLRQLEGIAGLAGLAIANAQHFDAVRREGARMAALEDAKSKFLRLASHELRSPIAVLRGYLSMLSDGTFDGRREEIAEVYEMMDAKVRQMELLVGQMLDAARLEEGRLRVDLARLDLRRPVEDAVESARPMMTAHHDLRVAMPDHPVEVVADAWRLTTIVANLLGNALKYSPDGGPVRCVVRVEDGSAIVEVADRGLGIAEADRATLFTRFGRIVTPENSHIPGTGLGLHLSRELAQMQGGELGVTSEAGAGSTFTLTLPLAGPGDPSPGDA